MTQYNMGRSLSNIYWPENYPSDLNDTKSLLILVLTRFEPRWDQSARNMTYISIFQDWENAGNGLYSEVSLRLISAFFSYASKLHVHQNASSGLPSPLDTRIQTG